jgi:hypothetical protein
MHPKVIQGTADLHHTIADAPLPEAAGVMDDTTAFDAAVDMLNAHAALHDAPMRLFHRVLGTRQAPFGPIGANRGEAAPVWEERTASPPAARPARSLGPRPPRGAWPTLSGAGWGHPPASAGLSAAPPRGHESTDGLCSGPSRTATPAPPDMVASPLISRPNCGWDGPIRILARSRF